MTKTNTLQKDHTDRVGTYAANLSLIEVGLGSVVHGLKLPFGGQVLSINQCVILSHAARRLGINAKTGVFTISTIAATLKSLSPAGNKLGPMLSISMQGFLFALGLFGFGVNVFGIALGAALASVWAFIQPFITLYLFFGHNLVEAFQFYMQKMESYFGLSMQTQIDVFAAVILLKALLTTTLCLFFYRFQKGTTYFESPPSWIQKSFPHSAPTSAEAGIDHLKIAGLALKDLTRPLFLVSIALMVIFFAFSKTQWSEIIWLSLRPLAIAFIFFFVSRHPWVFQQLGRFRGRPAFQGLYSGFDRTLEILRKTH